MKIALYSRVSTNNQTTENQTVRLIEHARMNGLQYDLYEETESSRKTRPIKQELMAKLRNKEYTAVVIYKLDRWARSSRELILDTKEILDKGIAFISLSDNLDFSTASGKLHFQILSAFAEFERELIRERTIQGIQRKKSEGYIFKGRPKGSKDNKKRKNDGYLQREENKRNMVKTKLDLPSNN
jgi:putative DNA-invertase from lambdoid prophage Rac